MSRFMADAQIAYGRWANLAVGFLAVAVAAEVAIVVGLVIKAARDFSS